MTNTHTFHIPVMGIGFTIDTPLKVAPYGIDSVISLVDDILMEKLRKMYCEKFQVPYQEITDKIEDFRAKRVTSYLNMIHQQAENKIEELKNITSEKIHDLKEYFNMLPDCSSIKAEFKALTSTNINLNELKNWVKDKLSLGSIDVNIMTKVDRANYINGEKLSVEYNDAQAALRGYANSDLSSSIILSAGMNPVLYNYLEHFEDFFPDINGNIKKKVILKVSDYRSALIQGKFLAKKGIWVSEFRIESGLNCGGHAFASEGFLIGPILEEFRDRRQELIEAMYEILTKALTERNRVIPAQTLPLHITAQGGVGTAEEHNFLIEHYNIDSVGWGSPFLLVPEAVSIDNNTVEMLAKATEKDLYLSNISPLGVPFNSFRGNTKDIEKQALINKGKPGSPCPKKYVAMNSEYTEIPICSASRRYQRAAIKDLDSKNLEPAKYKKLYDKIVEKSCICVGLGTASLLANNIDTKAEGTGVSVCPGPNIAYFSRKASLKEMVDHIYGRANIITRTDRPNMFVKELKIYIDFLKNKIEETKDEMTKKQKKSLQSFAENLIEGNNYYHKLFNELKDKFTETKESILNELAIGNKTLQTISIEIEKLPINQ